jgi:hypothetical protein
MLEEKSTEGRNTLSESKTYKIILLHSEESMHAHTDQ